MAKASSHAAKTAYWLRYLVQLLQDFPLHELTAEARRALPGARTNSRLLTWVLAIGGTFALLCWNSRLVLATGTGFAVMVAIYLLHDWKPTLPWAEIRKVLNGWNQPLALAVLGGGMASFTAYLALSIWADSTSPWIATGAMLQGGATLIVLLLLSGQVMQRSVGCDRISIDQRLADLTAQDPLKRLIAIRQLTKAVVEHETNLQQQRVVAGCLRLLLRQEQESLVRDAAFDGLQQIEQQRALKPSQQPAVQPPLRHQRPRQTQRLTAPGERLKF